MAYNPGEARDKAGKWTKGGHSAGVDTIGKSTSDRVLNAVRDPGFNVPAGVPAHQQGVAKLAAPPADGTYDRYGRTPHAGFMVGGAPEHGTRYTGVWTDTKTGQTFREKSQRVNSEVLARSLARKRNQIAVWDLTHSREIKTGGTGEYKAPKH